MPFLSIGDMKMRPAIFSACAVGILVAFLAGVKTQEIKSQNSNQLSPNSETPHSAPLLAPEDAAASDAAYELAEESKSITVKVLVGGTWGSGIIVMRRDKVYTVLTNQHVLAVGDEYRIQTSDDRIHEAVPYTETDLDGHDLGLLKFSSETPYEVAIVGNSSDLQEGDAVFATGFTLPETDNESAEFKFVGGKIALKIAKPLVGGYQVAYTNNIEKGMSGGPLLNDRGEVVAVNGMHVPLFGAPYIYRDGETPDPALREQMRMYSWGIPIASFLQVFPLNNR